jgi:hypothetical protein
MNEEYLAIVNSARELAIDLSPVSAFSLSLEQGLNVFITSDGISIEDVLYTFAQLPKVYNLVNRLKEVYPSAVFTFPEFYIPLEYTSNLAYIDQVIPDEIDLGDEAAGYPTELNFTLNNFFSNETINKLIYSFLENYPAYGCAEDISTEEIAGEVKGYDFNDITRASLWVSFWLLEEKKKTLYSSPAYKSTYGNSDSSFLTTDKAITTSVGNAFTVTETQKDDGMNADGFTSLWGDKESLLSKTQLYIRTKYELLFKDFSLRDNSGVSILIPDLKAWRPFDYENNTQLSDVTRSILQQD